ncbi:YaiI/YqxD family protein [Dongia sp.]|uniref:YaiI/YqxD family protein n=1 Tax=Dongia sp. TaxID=1977262 RepID=UPI0035B30909
MSQILVDADACPVKAEIIRVAERHGIAASFVSNSGFRPHPNPLIRNIVVGDKFDAADDWIVEQVKPGDIVITADIQLADRCLKAGAEVIGNTGKPFTMNSIGTALAMRELSSQLRDMGEIKGGGPAFSQADRSRFLNALEVTVQKMKRRGV